MLTDATHAPDLTSWVTSAQAPDCDFTIQNLPLGRFSVRGDEAPVRVGVAIGDQVLDLKLAAEVCPWHSDTSQWLVPLAAGDLAAFMALGRPVWRALRADLSLALSADSEQAPFLESCLIPQSQVLMHMPCRVGDYTDFYTGIHHARRVGSLMRPDEPLLPNYKFVPIGYHGRASSVGVGHDVIRPRGQTRSSGELPHGFPSFGPCKRLDYELELGLWLGAANTLGQPVGMVKAEDHVFGVSLLNDWSARDMQAWEYQPLGPFLAKSFVTHVSPWLVSWDALAPYRRAFVRPEGDPLPLPHLDSDFNRAHGAIDMHLAVQLQTARMKAAGLAAVQLSQSNWLDAGYWTVAQMIAHHTSNGCNLQIGDLLGTGTLSGSRPEQSASLLELTQGGKQPLTLPNGEQRSFLEDGDTVTLRAWCAAPGAARVGLGHINATVQPSPA
jgi:fumarylacetoacetase